MAGPVFNEKTKWHVLVGSFMGYTFDAMDIFLLAVSMPLIMADLAINKADAGLLATATLLGVGVSGLVAGWFSDNFGRRTAMISSLVVFSILTAAVALATSWFQIFVLRFLAGLGLGGIWGVIAAYIAETWPIEQRGRAAAFVMSSFPVGAGLASFMAGVITPRYGWRVLFVFGAIAIVAAIYVYLFVPESKEWQEQKDEKEKQAKLEGSAVSKVSISEIFAPETMRYVILSTMVASFALIAYWGSTTWLPTFLVKERGLSMAVMSNYLVVLNIGMFIGYNAFGILADRLGKKTALIISFVGTACILPLYAFVEDKELLFWIGPIYAFFMAFVGIFGSYFGELFPTRIRATASGFCFNIGRGFSAFAPFILGSFATQYSLSAGIALCAVIFLMAAVTMLFLPSTEKKA